MTSIRRVHERRARLAVVAGLLGSASLTVLMLATASGTSAPSVVAVPGATTPGAGVGAAGLTPAPAP